MKLHTPPEVTPREVFLENPDPLAAVRKGDGTVDWLRVGQAEQARRTGQAASQDHLDCLDWLHAHGGTFNVAMAAERYIKHLKAIVRVHGGVIVNDRSRSGADGRRIVTRTVRRFRPKGTAPMTRTAPRAREHRPGRARRAASTRSSARSGDSPDDDSAPPPPLALAPKPRAIYAYACLTAEPQLGGAR